MFLKFKNILTFQNSKKYIGICIKIKKFAFLKEKKIMKSLLLHFFRISYANIT